MQRRWPIAAAAAAAVVRGDDEGGAVRAERGVADEARARDAHDAARLVVERDDRLGAAADDADAVEGVVAEAVLVGRRRTDLERLLPNSASAHRRRGSAAESTTISGSG